MHSPRSANPKSDASRTSQTDNYRERSCGVSVDYGRRGTPEQDQAVSVGGAAALS
jgi:hypothetical protein